MNDRYEILDVVARGAMATVWRARDVRLDRVVAVKRPDTSDADSAFVTAARTAAAVTHPNLLTIFDTGTDETGPYLVMEFVDGPTLAEMGGSSLGAAALGGQIASALASLHSAGMVHRDVRPSNIMLGPLGPRLTSFGTARTLGAATASTVGTPRFQAPEVLAGSEPTSAADIYALGAVLSWMASQTEPDAELSAVVASAMSADPGSRPTAATLAERLSEITAAPIPSTAIAPMVVAPPSDATRQFDTAPVPVEETDAEPTSPGSRRRLVAVIAVLSVVLVAAILFLAGGDDADPIAAETTTTVVDATATTVAPETPDTTIPEESGGVFETVRIFITFIRETPGEILDRSGAEEIISDVADGVSEAIRGNDEEAESSLTDAVVTVEEEIQSDSVVDRAIELISRLARQLGLDVEDPRQPTG